MSRCNVETAPFATVSRTEEIEPAIDCPDAMRPTWRWHARGLSRIAKRPPCTFGVRIHADIIISGKQVNFRHVGHLEDGVGQSLAGAARRNSSMPWRRGAREVCESGFVRHGDGARVIGGSFVMGAQYRRNGGLHVLRTAGLSRRQV